MTMEIMQKEDQCGNQTDPTCYSSVCSCWQTPPADIMEMILQRFTNFADRIRSSIVCKDWNSIIMPKDICAAAPPLFPWLLLPQAPDDSKKYLRFVGDERYEELLNLKLPKRVRGGWIYGSSKGWLIIVKERGLNSKMFLFNPISRVLLHLPSLRTIPSFKKVIKTRKWELVGAKEFCCHVALATHTNTNFSESLTVAAVFNDRKTLGLCRPGDKAWTITEVLDINENCFLFDILFSSGTLYALVRSQTEDGVVGATHTISTGLGDHVAELKLKLVYDKHEYKNKKIDKRRENYAVVYNGTYNSMLVESTNKEILLTHQMLDFRFVYEDDDQGDEGNENIEGIDQDENGDEVNNDVDNDNGDANIVEDDIVQEGNIMGGYDHEDDGEGNIMGGNYGEDNGEGNGDEDDDTIDENEPGFNPELRTRNFIAYRLDTEKKIFTLLQCLGDQMLFCGNDGSFSQSSSPLKDSHYNINFARNSAWDYEASPETRHVCEIGFYKLGEGKALRGPTKRRSNMSIRYQGCWFTPKNLG